MTTLTSSDVAVSMFPVVGVDLKADVKVLYTTGKPGGSQGSVPAASAVINEALFQHSVFRFQSCSRVTFSWTGSLGLADQATMDQVVSEFMSSDAVPGSGNVLLKPAFKRTRSKSADSSLQLLHQMRDRGWAEQAAAQTDASAVGWCLTAEGFSWVSPRVALTNPVSVLQPRNLEDRGQWTRYEFMAFLRNAGWVALQLPSKKRGGLEMQICLPDGSAEEASASEDGSRKGRTWFFQTKLPVVSRHYLRAMLAIEENRDALMGMGLQRVFHLASVKYFQCLVQLASGAASLQALLDLEPKQKSRAVAKDSMFLAVEPGPSQPRPPAIVGDPRPPAVVGDQDDCESVVSQDAPPDLGPGDDVEMEPPFSGEGDPEAVDQALAILNEEPADVGAGPADGPELPEPADDGPARRRQDKTHRWGAFLITHKIQKQGKAKPQQSWQATCPHPAHNIGSRKCTKTMSFNADDAAQEMTTLWRVRHWCNSVFLFFDNKVEHQAYHPLLEDLPEEATITACRVDSIHTEPSEPSDPRPNPSAASSAVPSRKRKRADAAAKPKAAASSSSSARTSRSTSSSSSSSSSSSD